MTDDRFEELLARLRDEHNLPPSTPRDLMWERIAAARQSSARRRRRVRPAIAWPIAAAALLLLGIGIGNNLSTKSRPQLNEPTKLTAPTRVPRSSPYVIFATRHLDRAEALLTQFENGVTPQVAQAQLHTWAQQLLSDTRLLLDSPAVDQPTMRSLLSDVELLLAIIVQSDTSVDPHAIADGLRNSGLLERLRARIPAETI
jgi:hypothetical protein